MRVAIAILFCGFLATGCLPESTGGPPVGTGTGGTGTGDVVLPPPGPDAAQVTATFKGCMTQANWDATNMQSLAAVQGGQGGRCADCHVGGAGRFFASFDPTLNFTKNQDEFFNGVFQVSGATIVPAYGKLDNAGKRNGHRTYDLPSDVRESIEQFIAVTNACQ